jgi:curved DNA-binding protein CbpA
MSTAFQILGLAPTATAAEVRTKFKVLALLHHPDKVEKQSRDEATERFREINEAYEYCISHIDLTISDNSEEQEPEDNTEWRGKLPEDIFNANSEWWNDLKGDEPEPVKQWAIACENALRFASIKLDETEMYILNTEYSDAYNNFELWRRKHIEKPAEEEKLQQDIAALPERLQAHAREALNAKRATSGYTRDNYQEDHDEEYYFDEWEALADEEALPSGTWRTLYNSTNNVRVPPQQRLALFRKQVAALEQRTPTFGIQERALADEKRRLKKRQETEAFLVKEVEQAEKVKREGAILTSLSPKKQAKKITTSFPAATAELEYEPVPYDRGLAQRGALPKASSKLPESWEDDCEE